MRQKVCHIIHSHCAGSLERLIISFSRKLKCRGIDSLLIFIKEEDEKFPAAQTDCLKAHVLQKQKGMDLSLVNRLGGIIRQEGIGIVHSHDQESVFYATLATRMAFKKCLHTQHVRTYKHVADWVYALNSFIVCASEDLKRDLQSFNWIHSKKIRIVYNGIDLAEVDAHLNQEKRNKLRQQLGIKDEAFVIGNIARCIKEEDQASIIKALRKMASRELDAQLLIAGDGPLKSELQTIAKDYGVGDRVKFTSVNASALDALNAMDCLVLATFSEGRPVTLLEAMAARKPVIATTIGANKEVIEERKNGYLVPCGFPERIHSALMRLKAIDSLPAEIGEAGRKRVEEFFTLDQMARGYGELYDQI